MEKTQLKEHLKHYHLGERSAVTSRELETAFGVSGKELRDAVNALRRDGIPIASGSGGYFYGAQYARRRDAVYQHGGRRRCV